MSRNLKFAPILDGGSSKLFRERLQIQQNDKLTTKERDRIISLAKAIISKYKALGG